ncbi:alkylation response protein AidB-like acyl-CoA dehydrogenase [Thermocatellispora tengchongensis]|uniref:Alkylation response protein AidB-like acyl-CoA dehydrogenase n=1 Tax=Thermocatellispora tengchongensis TaxID=1073253 RepID=A0A840PGF5_9ACTN|nr:acyl-CoA dehydrogenase family protein [Thermocatellispora tengchongensis]MBB5136570.1 alkylation response protein AidB-like acyl-CoA dehydrogenase [Thermocatellispora tengchongensis]
MTSLLYSEVEEELRAAVRGVLADKSSPASVLARVESDAPYDMGLWKTLAADMGVAGLLIPESRGGAGASAREVAVVLEELGRSVAPVPFLTSAVLATTALLAAPEDPGDLLSRLASGDLTAALAVPFSASPYGFRDETVTAGADGTLSGRVTAVAGAAVADVLLVPASGALYAVEAGHATVETVPSLDLTRPIATVTLWSAPAVRIASDLSGVRRALLTGAGLLASEQLGVAKWCLDTTLAYLKERHQFARPIGSFQAIKHRMADLWLDVVRARAAARGAADALAGEEDPSLAVAVAQAWCGDVAVHVAEEALQLHGGIGMTWEHPLHLFLKRAKAAQLALGTPGDHRQQVGVLADLPA